MGSFIILCILACGYLVYPKVASTKAYPRRNIDTNFENAMGYVMDYCSNDIKFVHYDHKYENKNIITSKDGNDKCKKDNNFITSLCQVVRHGNDPLPGTTNHFSVRETSKL